MEHLKDCQLEKTLRDFQLRISFTDEQVRKVMDREPPVCLCSMRRKNPNFMPSIQDYHEMGNRMWRALVDELNKKNQPVVHGTVTGRMISQGPPFKLTPRTGSAQIIRVDFKQRKRID